MTKFTSARAPALLPWTLVSHLLHAKAQPRHVAAQTSTMPAAKAEDKDEPKDLLQRLREAGL